MPLVPIRRDPTTGWLVGEGEDPDLFLHPAALIEKGAQPSTILGIVQESVIRVLEEVMNRWPTYQGLGRRWRQRLAQRIEHAARVARALEDRGLCTPNLLSRAASDPSSQALACIQLARQTALQLDLPLDEVEITPTHWRPDRDPPHRGRIDSGDLVAQLAAQLGESVEGMYIHGSVALNEATGFSDFDGSVLLAASVEEDPDALRRAARGVTASTRLLLASDALQHHGWSIMAPFILNAYPENMLPVESLEEGSVVFGSGRLVMRSLRCRTLARRRLWSMVQVFRALRSSGAPGGRHRPYDQKLLLSQFMLLPALYLQATDRYVSKRRSFSLVRDELPDLPWATMDEATTARSNWTQPELGRVWRSAAAVAGTWETQAVWRRLSGANRDSPPASPISDDWIVRMAEFAESLLAIAEKSNRQKGAD